MLQYTLQGMAFTCRFTFIFWQGEEEEGEDGEEREEEVEEES